MTIQNPTYLWALLGLLVPLAIHLWSRKAGKTVKVGSTQWLIASENTRFSSLQFNEVFLFAVRTFIVLLTVLILLDLVQKRPTEDGKTAQTWVLVEEALLEDVRARPQIDSLVKAGLPLHLLKPGMPIMSPKALAQKTLPQKEPAKASLQTQLRSKAPISLNYWSYLTELDAWADAPKKVVVFAQNTQQRFYGTRPHLGLEVEWINLPEQRKHVFLLDALQLPKDSLLLSIGLSDENGTQVIQEKIRKQANTKIKGLPSVIVKSEQVYFAQVPNEGIQMRVPTPKKVQIVYNQAYNLDQQYLKAALEAVGEYMQTKVQVQTTLLDQFEESGQSNQDLDWAIFLGKPAEGAKIDTKMGRQQIWQRLSPTRQWFEQDEVQPTMHYLRRRTNPAINPDLLKVGFLEELSQLLFVNPNAQERLAKFDRRKVALGQMSPQKKKQVSKIRLTTQNDTENQAQSYHLLLWLGLVIGIVAERLIQANRLKA